MDATHGNREPEAAGVDLPVLRNPEWKSTDGLLNTPTTAPDRSFLSAAAAAPVAKPSDFTRIVLLGKGDVGRVFLVRHKENGRIFAMKVLDKADLNKRNKVPRVLTEQAVLKQCDHPFLVRLYYSFHTVQHVFFVMDYCAGGEFFRTLQLQPHKRMPEAWVRFYISEVVLALEYLHTLGIVYRDLKPENILIHWTGHIKLADFDLSKIVKRSDNPSPIAHSRGPKIATIPTLTRTNSFVGTEEYIPPEVIAGFGHNAAMDWWTLGILTYEMLFGKTPFRGKSRQETFSQILHIVVSFPVSREYPVSDSARALIRRLLAKEPRRRLGATHGAVEVKEATFFRGLNWALVRNMKPPLVPELDDPLDTSHFNTVTGDTDTTARYEAEQPGNDSDKSSQFFQFNFTSTAPFSGRYGGEEPKTADLHSPSAAGVGRIRRDSTVDTDTTRPGSLEA